MTDNQAKSIVVERIRPETTLIFMPTLHTSGEVIGIVPFVFTDDDHAPVEYECGWLDGYRMINFKGIVYRILGYGPTDTTKQRALIGPYPP